MKDGGNSGQQKAKVINTVKYDKLAMVYIPGMMYQLIGLKINKELKHPFLFLTGEKALAALPPDSPPPPPGTSLFALVPMPFLDEKDCFTLEGGYFWHPVREDQIQKTFHRMISPIIVP